MSGLRIVLVALMLAPVLSSSASLLQGSTGGAVAYQFDGTNHHDAPGTCAAASPAWAVALPGSTDGMVVPVEDTADVFLLEVAPATIGQRLDLQLLRESGSSEVAFDITVPGCGSDVALPENWPAPYPLPPLPLVGEVQATPLALDPITCDGAWRFKVTSIDAAPASIHVAWTDGTEATVPLDYAASHNAFYAVDAPDVTLKGAWANLPEDWTGAFRVLTGPCGAVDGGAVYGDPPLVTPTHVAFTPTQAGSYAVTVREAGPLAAPGPVPLSCHFCFPQVEQLARGVSYRIDATSFAATA